MESLVQFQDKDREVRYTFYITYALLMTTATITFIEAIRTSNPQIRHILNLETCISVVAAFFYGVFMNKINKQNIDYKDINLNRYLDWSITTPIMLLVLILALGLNIKKKVKLLDFVIILVLNFGMLYAGYVGEIEKDKKTPNNKKIIYGNIIGFIFFTFMYGFIYFKFVRSYKNFDNNILFGAFVFLWALYGVVWWMEERNKNVGYNVLDLLSKCFVGIFFWAYFTKVIVL
tara:strand:+ start:682 stop:1377 length:696 start_codon:yes stop_codon:yes gene_type:complete